MNWQVRTVTFLGPFLLLLAAAHESTAGMPWTEKLEKRLASVDRSTEGELGLYVKRLSDGTELRYQSDRLYYLSSTVKVPVAVALLRQVEAGKISLDQELTLQQSDFVDGSGEVIMKEPGARMKVSYLLETMLRQSDSTATDLLIRLIGQDALNKEISGIEPGFRPITTLLDVRYGAYGEMTPKAKELTNMDFIRFKRAKDREGRVQMLTERLGLKREDLKAKTVDDAFEKYYAKNLNSASLESFGAFLEKLEKGELLNKENTALVLDHMQKMVTGSNRILAGLPKGTSFAQKTGTQVRRMCNVGIVNPKQPDEALVVAACLEGFNDQAGAEATLKKVGAALSRSGVL